ncbi:MAG: hypothetical protein H7Z75_18350 [Ferruginibacter sp.]|nr:hypothetical protein [Cytophagales bacterium]
MRAFEFDFRGQTFEAHFRHGTIHYDPDTLMSYFGVDPGALPDRVTAAQAQSLLPPQQRTLFKEWHATAQDALFELIKLDNEID